MSERPTFEELREEANRFKTMSPDRRRTYRNKQLLARGLHPATKVGLAENGETCGSCVHSVKRDRWWKCALVPHTGGPGTDIRVSWPACVKWVTQ